MKAQQLELDGAAQVFNLAGQETQDGAALAASITRSELDHQEAQKAQKPLFDLESSKPTS